VLPAKDLAMLFHETSPQLECSSFVDWIRAALAVMAAQVIEKKKPVFVKVDQLRPDTSGHNLTVKVRNHTRSSAISSRALGMQCRTSFLPLAGARRQAGAGPPRKAGRKAAEDRGMHSGR
jgi:hypothetical protein